MDIFFIIGKFYVKIMMKMENFMEKFYGDFGDFGKMPLSKK